MAEVAALGWPLDDYDHDYAYDYDYDYDYDDAVSEHKATSTARPGCARFEPWFPDSGSAPGGIFRNDRP